MGEIPVSNVGNLRKQVGLTQRQLADLAGVTETTIRNWENNRSSVEVFERIARLCNALGCSVEDLVRYEQIGEE
ncbi:MAG: helix-turn-helix transcriptional regulator [Actinomycetota bacterium]